MLLFLLSLLLQGAHARNMTHIAWPEPAESVFIRNFDIFETSYTSNVNQPCLFLASANASNYTYLYIKYIQSSHVAEYVDQGHQREHLEAFDVENANAVYPFYAVSDPYTANPLSVLLIRNYQLSGTLNPVSLQVWRHFQVLLPPVPLLTSNTWPLVDSGQQLVGAHSWDVAFTRQMQSANESLAINVTSSSGGSGTAAAALRDYQLMVYVCASRTTAIEQVRVRFSNGCARLPVLLGGEAVFANQVHHLVALDADSYWIVQFDAEEFKFTDIFAMQYTFASGNDDAFATSSVAPAQQQNTTMATSTQRTSLTSSSPTPATHFEPEVSSTSPSQSANATLMSERFMDSTAAPKTTQTLHHWCDADCFWIGLSIAFAAGTLLSALAAMAFFFWWSTRIFNKRCEQLECHQSPALARSRNGSRSRHAQDKTRRNNVSKLAQPAASPPPLRTQYDAAEAPLHSKDAAQAHVARTQYDAAESPLHSQDAAQAHVARPQYDAVDSPLTSTAAFSSTVTLPQTGGQRRQYDDVSAPLRTGGTAAMAFSAPSEQTL